MLQHTFCHINGIGRKTEERLWSRGIQSWHQWQDPPPISIKHTGRVEAIKVLEQSLDALSDNPHFFIDKLASCEHWRIFPHYRHTTAFLDIETTGLGSSSEITTIALYDGKEIKTFVNGKNLQDFETEIFNYQVIVTYNGKSFDVPFIENYFRIKLHHAHIDLRHVLSKLGFKGGLKGCEKAIGIDRNELDGVDGYFAVLLWAEYENYANEKALETLLAYNIADTVNLELLLIYAYNKNTENTPFAKELFIEHPLQPPCSFHPDIATVYNIRSKHIAAARW